MQIRKCLLLSLWATFCFTAPGHAALNDVAVFAPGVDNWMTLKQQKDVGAYLKDEGILPGNQVYNYANQGDLVNWMNSRMFDGKSDVLLIVDLAPGQVFNDNDNSLAEAWMESGNMLIWTGSEPFRSSVDVAGIITDHGADGVNDGANKVLDVKGENLCMGYASFPQKYTSVSTVTPDFYNYLPSLNLNYTGADMRSLSYVDVLTEAENVATWDDAPHMVIDEMFAENDDASDTTHVYESDAIVLTMRKTESDRKGNGGQYAQFYCYKGLIDGVDSNEYRKPVLYEFLNNWVAKDIDLIYVQAGASGGDGSEANPYGTIQAGINAADEFSRDRVIVKPGTYYESLVMKQSVKLISAGEDERIDVIGYIDDLLNDVNHPELNYTYNTFTQVNGKKGLTRAEDTIIDGTGQQQLCFNGGGNPAICPMVDIPKWATLGTWVDGFTVQNMEEVDHTECGHAHALQTRGSSATLIDNILWYNGSGGLGSHSMFNEENICENTDFRYSNVKYNAHPALINNIVGESNGPNLGNNHYSYAIMYHNEAYRSGYYMTGLPMADHEAPGIGNQHGAHAYIYKNVVYDSAWTGIGAKRGENNNTATPWEYYIDRPTRPIVRDNYVFNSGTAQVEEFGAGIGGSNTGGPDPYSGQDLYHFIDHNFVFSSQDATIGIRYWEEEDGEGTSVPRETGYVIIKNNTGTEAGKAGIGIDGAYDVAEISHNEVADNGMAGIGMKNEARVGAITANSSHNNEMAGIGMKLGAQVAAITDNLLVENILAGIGHDGSGGRVIVGEESGNTIEWNQAAGIGMISSEVGLMSMNTIRYNALPGITVINSDVGLIKGSASTEGPERLSGNGRGDLHNSAINTVGLVVAGEGATANISNLIVEESGMLNVKIGLGAVVTMDGTTVRGSHNGATNIEVLGEATISNCLVENAAGSGLVAANADAVLSLENTTIRNNGTAGVKIVGARVTSFDNNTISGNNTVGISAGSLAAELTIDNSSVINNGTPGIELFEAGFMVTVLNSNISNNGIGGFKMSNSSVDIQNSVIHNYNGGVMLHDDVEHASTVSIYNCDLNHPESSVRVFGIGSLSIIDSSLLYVEAQDTESVYIAGCTNTGTDSSGIYLEDVGWADIIGNDLGGRYPIGMYHSSGNVANNISDLSSDGYVFKYSSNVNFYHNTIYGGDNFYDPVNPADINTYAFIAKYDSVVNAYNNIITGAMFCVASTFNSIVHADNNLLWGCRNDFVAGDGGIINIGDNNLIDVEPQLVDPLNRDYHLTATSPCIDAGDSEIEVTIDMDGDSRPQGDGSDIGADEAM